MTTKPAPRQLAEQIAPHLRDVRWGIGGSTLLHHLGIEPSPNDLDIVIDEADFARASAQLEALFGEPARPPSARIVSTHFARFQAPLGATIDAMAGIAVKSANGLTRWHFEDAKIDHAGGLPWMHAEDWLTLYALFERPQRVAQVAAYLQARRTMLKSTG